MKPDVGPVPVRVPGSVQAALRDAGILPDWNYGLNSRLCDWVENRDWLYTAQLPDSWLADGQTQTLCFPFLDGAGDVFINDIHLGRFDNAFIPHRFDITNALSSSGNVIRILFDLPPRWLGQTGRTSLMRDLKPRFNYGWDWTPRLVQTGIGPNAILETFSDDVIESVDVRTEYNPVTRRGTLLIAAKAHGERLVITLDDVSGKRIVERTEPIAAGAVTVEIKDIPAEAWQPNGTGETIIYTLRVAIPGHDELTRRIGFRSVKWLACEDAPKEATPWICSVNGKPVFLQGINWTPVRPNSADVTNEQIDRLLETYRDIGCNLLRVWGGAAMETPHFYDRCDELGLMIWQEFPLSSSGVDNNPPTDAPTISRFAETAAIYIDSLKHHPCLILWCGGNELTKLNSLQPEDDSHPMLTALKSITETRDPGRRFVATSPSGPSFSAMADTFGKSLHWDVHGPWRIVDESMAKQKEFFEKDDSLFRSETGVPGSGSVEIIRKYAGDFNPFPASGENPLWRLSSWWIDWEQAIIELGRQPKNLEDYVHWSQRRQAEALSIAAKATKSRFPKCGGFIVWMGHDCFPCPANTSIIDFEGNMKPAAIALKKIFKQDQLNAIL
ncbi:MAG: glycoside hydrolase family 2 TIM barrel-domain containing protein [Planctomycetota bacterium]